MEKVVVVDHGFADVKHEQAAAQAGGAAFAVHQARMADDVVLALRDARVGVVQFAPVTADAIAGMAPDATLIRYGAGFDNIDIAAARAAGVKLAYVPDYCTQEVADHTAALAMALLRRVVPLDRNVRGGGWSVLDVAAATRPFSETVVGLLGVGRIGRETMARLKPFGFSFRYHDPYGAPIDGAVACATAAELFAGSNMLILHLPLTAESRHIVDDAALALMPPGAFVVNTARGGLVDEDALAEAVSSGRIAGAALDVFEQEPLAASSPLRACPGIILHPHAAWYSTVALDRLQTLVADEIARALSGREPRCPIPSR